MDPVPKPEPAPPEGRYPDAEWLQALARELYSLSNVVDGYGHVILQRGDDADVLRRASGVLIAVAGELREITGVVRASARLAAQGGGQQPGA